MSLDLVVSSSINSQPQQVAGQDGSKSPLWLNGSNVTVGQGSTDFFLMGVIGVPPTNGSHLQIGVSSATSGQPSSKLTLAGYNIQHAGFFWTPSSSSAGQLKLAFGGNNDPSLNTTQFNFQSNGNFIANGTITASGLNVTGPLSLSANNLTLSDLTTPPAGVNTVDLVVDPNTGKIYRQN
jgi:hypothetical protein